MLLAFLPLALLACARTGAEGKLQNTQPPGSEVLVGDQPTLHQTQAPATGVPADAQSRTPYTPEQLAALDLPAGIKRQDPLTIPIAQRMTMPVVLLTAFNAAFGELRQLPRTLPQILNYVAIWPLIPNGQPWPITDQTSGPYPRVLLRPGGAGAPFSAILESDGWDNAPTDIFAVNYGPDWSSETGPVLLNQQFPESPRLGDLAHNIMCPVARYQVLTKAYAPTPAAAFSALHMGIDRKAEADLKLAYPRREFWRMPDWSMVGLLLEGPGHSRLLVKHKNDPDGMNGTVWVWGYTVGAEHQIDRELSKMVLWATWDEGLAGVPRIDIPTPPSTGPWNPEAGRSS